MSGLAVDRVGSVRAAFRAGLLDLRDYPVLVSLTTVVVFVATLLVLAGPLLTNAARAGETYVTMNSELIVLLDPELTAEERNQATAALSVVDGVEAVRASEPGDVESLPPNQILRYQSGSTLTVEPTGLITVEHIQTRVIRTPGVVDAALGLGVPSLAMMEMVGLVLPWLALAFFVAGIILVANLSFMVARTRIEEADAMRMVGADTSSIWLRTGLVVALPTLVVVLAATALVALVGPPVVGSYFPDDVRGMMTVRPVLQTGSLLAAAATFTAIAFSLVAVWRVATK